MTTFAHSPVGSTAQLVPSSRRISARVALIELGEPGRTILSECFRQFGIEPVPVSSDGAGRLQREKFEACVVPVGSSAEPILESARTSASNSRMIIYGLGGSVQQAMKFSKYGINAVFDEPLERQSALKLVRSTQALVFHEFRRYARIPVITEVTVVVNGNQRFTASSQEISRGGMSLKSAEEFSSGQGLEISFALLTLPRIWVRGTVCWLNPASKSVGIRFDPLDERRLQIKKWVEAHLESSVSSS